jgi:hypothetical protein
MLGKAQEEKEEEVDFCILPVQENGSFPKAKSLHESLANIEASYKQPKQSQPLGG